MSESMASDDRAAELRCIQALDSDPLFEGARYTFSVERQGAGFDLVVTVSPYFVNLLTFDDRRRLETIAHAAAARALAAGASEASIVRISADGRVMLGDRELAELLPHAKQPSAAAPAAH